MWRWSSSLIRPFGLLFVFSTYVEVILTMTWTTLLRSCVLHVCGGDPSMPIKLRFNCLCSPRMWRWSQQSQLKQQSQLVFSTYVEVILRNERDENGNLSVLHVCGGDPNFVTSITSTRLCSPRMWRWSSKIFTKKLTGRVFSTYVEVILRNL